MSHSTDTLLPTCLEAGRLEAGCDEAGRGCLAGPVYAAAVILPDDFHHPWLNDSKQLTPARRDKLRPIIEAEAIAWAIGICTAQEIDTINILQASILAMHRALDGLAVKPGAVMVDGNRFKQWSDVPYSTMIKGDSRLGNIAAASILAKTHRDEYMDSLDPWYPAYGWAVNKGYPTRAHRQAIAMYGTSPYHRMTFRLV